MNKSSLRAGALACALLAGTALTPPALAQTAQQHRQLDANGVDVTHGDILLQMVEGSIGSGAGELALVRDGVWDGSNNGHSWDRINFRQVHLPGGTVRSIVTTGFRFEQFEPTGTLPTGSALTGSANSFDYRTADGTLIHFGDPSGSQNASSTFCNGNAAQGDCTLLPSTITSPNGTVVSLGWEVWTYCPGIIEPGETNCSYWARLATVSNSFGYAIRFNYVSGGAGGDGQPPTSWYQRTGATFHNGTVAGNPALASTSYEFLTGGITNVTDMGGLVWRVTGAGGSIHAIRRPGATTDTTTITGSPGAVTSITRDGVTTRYSRVVNGTTATMTITADDGNPNTTTDPVTVVVSDLSIGRPTSITDPLQRTTGYGYNNGRLERVTQPEGNYVHYTYDSRGNVIETRYVAKGSALPDIVTSASFDPTCANPVTCNQPNSTTDARQNVTTYTYNQVHGGVDTVTGPPPTSGATPPQTRYSYELLNGEYRLTRVSTCASGSAPACVGTSAEAVSELAYDSNGNVTSTTQRSGNTSGPGAVSATIAMAYDGLGNLLTVDGPMPGTADMTRRRYNAGRQVVGVVGPDPDGAGALLHRAVRTTFSNGLATKVEQGTVNSQSDADWAAFAGLQEVQTEYDAHARPFVQRVVAGGATYSLTQTSYDVHGRAECVAQRMNPAEFATASLPTNACTLDTEGSFGPDRITRTTYDAAGQVTQVQTGYGTSAAATEVATTYSNNGRQRLMTDGEGRTSRIDYDAHDRPNYMVFPDPATAQPNANDYVRYVYDPAGNVTQVELRDHNVIGYTYDALNRATNKNLPGSELDVTYAYDLLNRMTSASTSARVLTFGYDALGRNTSQAGAFGTASYQYDAAGRRTRMSYPGTAIPLEIGYTYNIAGEVSAITEDPSGGNLVLAIYTYDNLGRRTGIVRGNGADTSYNHDPVSRLSQLTQSLSGTANDLTLDFGYNPAGQIGGVARSNDSYAWTDHYAVNRDYIADGLNRFSQVGSIVPTYDARGNVTSAASPTYAYTSENRLSHVSGFVAATYDPLGRMNVITSGANYTKFDYDGNSLIAEYSFSNALLRRYVHGPGIDEPLVWYEYNGSGTPERRWFHADERGSVIAVSDSSANAAGTFAYDEYGRSQGGTFLRFRYTGQAWLTELDMYYYRARMYSPSLGRFMQTDPIGYGDGMNVYAYVSNDPVNLVDPLGLNAVVSACRWGTVEVGELCLDADSLIGGGGAGVGLPGSWSPYSFGGGGGQPSPPPEENDEEITPEGIERLRHEMIRACARNQNSAACRRLKQQLAQALAAYHRAHPLPGPMEFDDVRPPVFDTIVGVAGCLTIFAGGVPGLIRGAIAGAGCLTAGQSFSQQIFPEQRRVQ